MRSRQVWLVVAILFFIPLMCVDFAYAQTPARLEIERVQRKFQARWHGIHPAVDYGAATYVHWPTKTSSDPDVPDYPADGYYGTLTDSQQVVLVRDLADKFWRTAYLYAYYVKEIVGLQWVQFYTIADMPDISATVVDKDSAYNVLQVIDGYLDQFRYMRLDGWRKTIVKTSWSYSYADGQLDWFSMQYVASTQTTNSMLHQYMYDNIYYGDPNMPGAVLDPIAWEMTNDLQTYENTTFEGSGTGCEGWRVNGQIAINASDYDFYSAVCYLRGKSTLFRQIKSWGDPTTGVDDPLWVLDSVGYHPDVSIAGNDVFWAWAWTTDAGNNPVTEITDAIWSSPNIFTSSTILFLQDVETYHYTNNGTSYPFGGSEAGWRLKGSEVILRLHFLDDDEN